MKAVFKVLAMVAILGVGVMSQASALDQTTATAPIRLSAGTMECYFEIASTKRPGRYEIVQLPAFSVMNVFEYALENPLLENRILFRYNPGWATKTEISHVVINMSYNSANSGIEMPLILEQKFVTAIGRQGSDLIGAFLNCTVHPN